MKTILFSFAFVFAFIANLFGQDCPGALDVTNASAIIAQCGSTNNITFTVDCAVPNQEVSYAHGPVGADCFILPSGWTYIGTSGGGIVGSGVTRAERYTITVKPAAYTGGSLQVRNKANCGTPTNLYSNYQTFGISRPAANATISGPNNICVGSTGTFTLNGISAGSTVTWSVDGNMQINSGQNTTSVTVQGLSNGQGTISAQVNDQCGNRTTPSQVVTVGPAVFAVYTNGLSSYTATQGSNNSQTLQSSNPTCYITFNSSGNPASYSWQITNQSSSGSSLSTFNNGANANITCSGGKYLTAVCTVVTPCGTVSFTFSCYNTSGGARVAAYPNPANHEVTITALKEENQENNATWSFVSKDDSDLAGDVQLLNKNGQVVKSGQLKGGELTFKLLDLPNDIYYMQVNNGKTQVKKQ